MGPMMAQTWVVLRLENCGFGSGGRISLKFHVPKPNPYLFRGILVYPEIPAFIERFSG
jgi:hypothetical protein